MAQRGGHMGTDQVEQRRQFLANVCNVNRGGFSRNTMQSCAASSSGTPAAGPNTLVAEGADRPDWADMTTHLRTVATQAFQLWLRPEESALGRSFRGGHTWLRSPESRRIRSPRNSVNRPQSRECARRASRVDP